MIIVRNIESVINKYLDDFKKERLKKPEFCEVCGKRCKLVWHAKYMRKLITSYMIYYKIPIKRLFCPLCGHTFTLIPEFIKKFYRYSKNIIKVAVKELKKKKAIIYKVADKLAKYMEAVDVYPEFSTLYRWRKKFKTI